MTPEEINSCLSYNSSISSSWWLHWIYGISCYKDFLLIYINTLNFIFVSLFGFLLTRYFTEQRNKYESFQSYLSNIKDILAKESISDNNKEQIKLIIKALTEEVISSVDEERVKKVFNFLADASLIQKEGYPGIEDLKFSQILKSIELKNIDLRNIEKLRDVDFTNAKLSNISFRNSNLTGAKFHDANLVNVDFRKAIIRNVSFKGTTIDDIKYLSKRSWFKKQLIQDIDLTGIKIKNAKFYKVPSFLSYSVFSPILGTYELKEMKFKEVVFKNARFIETNLKNTLWKNSDLQKANFQDCNMSSCKFIHCDISHVTFLRITIGLSLDNAEFTQESILDNAIFHSGISIKNAIFNQARFKKTEFKARSPSPSRYKKILGDTIKVDLSGSIFKDCDLIETTFDRTILIKVDFSGSTITNTNFEGANLVDTDLSNASIDDKTSFKNALYSENTKFPQDFSPIEHEMKKVD